MRIIKVSNENIKANDIPRYCSWCKRSLQEGTNKTDPDEIPVTEDYPKYQIATHGICEECMAKALLAEGLVGS